MELADLTRGMRKNEFLEPENLIFAKPGWSEFHESSTEKNNFSASQYWDRGLDSRRGAFRRGIR